MPHASVVDPPGSDYVYIFFEQRVLVYSLQSGRKVCVRVCLCVRVCNPFLFACFCSMFCSGCTYCMCVFLYVCILQVLTYNSPELHRKQRMCVSVCVCLCVCVCACVCVRVCNNVFSSI